jgi:Entner-Doudoroff aldolase
MDEITQRVAAIGILPVIKLDRPDTDAAPLAKALVAGGVPAAEITFRAEGADRAIRIMREQFPDMLVGAGTVLSIEQVEKAHAAGAQFIVSPGLNPRTVAACQALGLPIFPGCITPTEIEEALSLGIQTVKFFPAEQAGGLPRIKAMSAPFNTVRFMPTGGINLENLGRYVSQSCIVACGGSYMVTDELISGQQWDKITELCRQSIAIIKEARGTRK